MTTLQEKHRPRQLDEIIGQPVLSKLHALVAKPRRSCWMLEGQPGIGKSLTAHVLADELGCGFFSKHVRNASALTKDTIKQLFGSDVRTRTMDGSPYHVVILEEFERCVSADARTDLKAALDTGIDSDDGGLARYCIVVATSNDVTKIEPALLERFQVLSFQSGPDFAACCQERLTAIWEAERPGEDMPPGWLLWGWRDDFSRFSMRVAMQELADAVESWTPERQAYAEYCGWMDSAGVKAKGFDEWVENFRKARVGV